MTAGQCRQSRLAHDGGCAVPIACRPLSRQPNGSLGFRSCLAVRLPGWAAIAGARATCAAAVQFANCWRDQRGWTNRCSFDRRTDGFLPIPSVGRSLKFRILLRILCKKPGRNFTRC